MVQKAKQEGANAGKIRILVVFVILACLVVAVIFLLGSLKKKHREEVSSASALQAQPAIRSIPGVDSGSEQYVKTQKEANLLQAKKALKTGRSAVPTITRPALVGSGSDFLIGIDGPKRSGCSPDELKRAKAAGVSASELRCKGCTAGNLRAFYTAAELKNAGFSASELKANGFGAKQLREAGFGAKDLVDAGFSANELSQSGYSLSDLQQAGVSASDLRKLGVSAKALRKAGFSAKQLVDAGFLPAELKDAGYNAKELKQLGVSVQALSDAGFSPEALIAAGATDAELAKVGVLPEQIKAIRAKVAAGQKLPGDCDIAKLTKAKQAGMSASALAKLNCGAAALRAAGFTASELRDMGLSAKDLKDAGFSASDLKAAGYDPSEMHQAGFSAADLKKAGFSVQALKAAGVDAKALLDAGYSAQDLKAAGFSASDLKQAGFSAGDLLKAGFEPTALRAAGYTAQAFKDAGLPPEVLKAAGFSQGDIIRAGFTQADINKSLARANPALLKKAGYDAATLKVAGLSALQLKDAGYTAEELLAAGYTPEALRKAGFTDAQLVQAGVDLKEIAHIKAKEKQQMARSGRASAARKYTAASQGSAHLQQTARHPQPEAGGAQKSDVQSAKQEVLTPKNVGADPEKVLALLRKRQSSSVGKEAKGQVLKQIQSNMQNQTKGLFGAWNPPPTQSFVQGDTSEDAKSSASSATATQSGGAQGVSQVASAAGQDVIKAGTIMFASLDTGINSDEVSPILATIVQGRLKGAKLLGQFTRTGKKVLLSFITMSLPGYPTSFSINAVAIDPDTARTAVASSVNSHYFLRYGSLLASSFLSGYASAVAQSGSTTTNTDTGNSIVTNPTLSPKEKIAVALGAVGTQFASQMSGVFSTPPTVKVNAGAGLGILFMADITLPDFKAQE